LIRSFKQEYILVKRKYNYPLNLKDGEEGNSKRRKRKRKVKNKRKKRKAKDLDEI